MNESGLDPEEETLKSEHNPSPRLSSTKLVREKAQGVKLILKVIYLLFYAIQYYDSNYVLYFLV